MLRDLLVERIKGSSRRLSRSELESPWFSGEFKSVLIESCEESPKIRLQLYPDLGSKALDLIATPKGIVGHWTFVNNEEQSAGTARLTRIIGISLLENATALTFERVVGARVERDGFLLDVTPVTGGDETQVFVLIDSSGAIKSRHYQDRGVSWTEQLGAIHNFEGAQVHWTISNELVTPISPPSPNLFQFVKSSGISP